jgi:hypothetical protein
MKNSHYSKIRVKMLKSLYLGQPLPHPVVGSQQFALQVALTESGHRLPSAKRISPPVFVPGMTVVHPS